MQPRPPLRFEWSRTLRDGAGAVWTATHDDTEIRIEQDAPRGEARLIIDAADCGIYPTISHAGHRLRQLIEAAHDR